MKIYDCFMYYNEDVILNLRLNYLNKFVDNFVIVESKFNHKGEKKNLNFNIKKFSDFKDKIKGAANDPRFFATGISVVAHMFSPIYTCCTLQV